LGSLVSPTIPHLGFFDRRYWGIFNRRFWGILDRR
jgi:hypothetical protein